MADRTSPVTPPVAAIRFESDRVAVFLETLEAMAAGQIDMRLPISARHDELDAIAHGINVLVGELDWAAARTKEAEEQKAAELRAAAARAEAHSEAMVKAVPDLTFEFLRDGTYVNYQVHDPAMLFVPPSEFLGRKICDVMPSALVDMMMNALDRACRSDDPIVIEYELPMAEPRFFEARLVKTGPDRLLAVVRDVTQAKRASDLIHDLAGRLIARQEIERQRIARDLHDDVSQRLTLLGIDIELIAAQAERELRTRLGTLSAQVAEIANAVHDISYELHPSRLRAIGLVAAVRSLCDDALKLRNLRVTFTHGAIPRSVDADVSLCLYRIVQEALHNVARHSGAREAQVSLTCDETHIALRIADSGTGFDPTQIRQGSLGLVSMQERVAFLQGQLAIDAVPGRGTEIGVRIPLAAQESSSPPPFVASA
jgi:signal transduction histidine kinase